VAAGSFRALFHPGALGVNYAFPVQPLGEPAAVRADLAALRTLFAQHGLPLKIEFNEPLFPSLPPMLEAAGLALTEREPLLLLTAGDFHPIVNPEVEVRFVRAGNEDGLRAYAAIFHQVLLELPGSPPPRAIESLRREIAEQQERSHALALLDGQAAATGFISSSEGVAEITRVGTLPAMRRRGVAATITSFMVSDRLARGDSLVWLTASGDAAQALYRKLGFRLAGDRLYYEEV
jgi:ribosomal protein S18 acetylase RimI-like enzyme